MLLQAGWLVFIFAATPWADMLFVEPPYFMMLVSLNFIVGTIAHALRHPDNLQGDNGLSVN